MMRVRVRAGGSTFKVRHDKLDGCDQCCGMEGDLPVGERRAYRVLALTFVGGIFALNLAKFIKERRS